MGCKAGRVGGWDGRSYGVRSSDDNEGGTDALKKLWDRSSVGKEERMPAEEGRGPRKPEELSFLDRV